MRGACVCISDLGTRRPSCGVERGKNKGHLRHGERMRCWPVCASPREHEEAKVALESSCVTAPSLIGESHPVRGRIRYHHQILNEIVPRMDAAPFYCSLFFSSSP